MITVASLYAPKWKDLALPRMAELLLKLDGASRDG